jgi:hypothetical protein
VLAAAAVGPGEYLEHVTVWVFEVHAAAAVPVVDHAWLGPARIGPVLQALAPDPAKGSVKIFLTNQEGVVLRRDRSFSLREVQRDIVVGFDDEKVREPGWCRQAEYPRQEARRLLLVTARDDGVIQLHAHLIILRPTLNRSHPLQPRTGR